MNPMPGVCPVCANSLHVTRLQCGRCGTGLDGVFALGRLQALTPEQIQFIETFVKCRGKIKDVETELGISYPTVVARLNEVVRAMGYEVNEGDMSEVDQYEMYEARVIQPQLDPLVLPNPPGIPAPPRRVEPPKAPTPTPPRMSAERREKILDDLQKGKITLEEAMKKLHGEG
jgi:hypothetical protein